MSIKEFLADYNESIIEPAASKSGTIAVEEGDSFNKDVQTNSSESSFKDGKDAHGHDVNGELSTSTDRHEHGSHSVVAKPCWRIMTPLGR